MSENSLRPPKRTSNLPAKRTSSAPPGTLVAEEQIQEFLAFRMFDETYGLPLMAVREILVPPPITGVPRAPGHVLGVISVRGVIITTIDLRKRLGLPAAEADKNTRILLVQRAEEVIGLLVDRVLQVFRLADDEVEYAAVVGGDMSEHILGIGRPRAGKGVRSASFDAETGAAEDEILILLNPGPLLRR